MNFKLGRFFYLAISFVIGSFFFLFGLFSLILPWSAFLQKIAVKFVTENTLIFFLFGLSFILIGLSIIFYTYIQTRHRYVEIKTGKRSVSIDENLFYQYLEHYWQEQFPKSHIPFQLNFKKNCLQVVAELPSLPLSDQKIFLERVKDDFSDLFGRVLGYPYDVHFIASFNKES